jgi:hypothetical protein
MKYVKNQSKLKNVEDAGCREGNGLGKMIEMMGIRMTFVGWRLDITRNIGANACTDNHSLNLCGGKVGATRKKEPASQKPMHLKASKKQHTL